jgi:peptidoglycan/xylan/chitin deacetylase (PgdA/CDA1 family)
MHDGGGDRGQTLAALPRIIESVQAQGYRLVPICH